ncbi:MAG: sulfite exporter TauE/SafE family protein [Actinobacteria bacterium]|nr:sulfite exporter TauE/SafE family protein [Actinomycetota bacterium]
MRLIAIGLVAGFFSALFGVGGGIVAVPLLILLAALPPHAATATSMGAIGITALAGAILYAVQGGHVEPGYALLVGLPAAAGAVFGTALQQRLSGRALTLAFAAFLALLALWLLLSAPAEADAAGVGDADWWRVAAAVALGLAAGTLAGLFGIGGGLLFVPTLVWLGLGQLEAEATSLLAILPTVAAGAWRQHRYGNLRPRTAVVLGLASVPAVAAGVLVAKALPEDTLQTLFVVLMLAVAGQLAWRSR